MAIFLADPLLSAMALGLLVAFLVFRWVRCSRGPTRNQISPKSGTPISEQLRYHESESITGTDDGRTTVNQSHHNGDPPIPFGTPLGTNGVDPAWELENRRRWRHMDP